MCSEVGMGIGEHARLVVHRAACVWHEAVRRQGRSVVVCVRFCVDAGRAARV